jgi:hypothetical protein
MLREDESRVPLREMARWLVPLGLVVIGIALFFILSSSTRERATPVHVDAVTP